MATKRLVRMACTVALVALGLAMVPTAASAHKLPMSYARSAATNAAIDWYLSAPDFDSFWVNNCHRFNAHDTSCDAHVEGTHYGDIHCGYTTCWETDTKTSCWKRVHATLRGDRVRYSAKAPHCTTTSDTDYF